MESKKLKFSLKTISKKTLANAMKKIRKKKSSGRDGLTQDQLVMGSKTLSNPLLVIINESIATGQFPESWKEAVVNPVLKKGSSDLLENYRPVSCTPAASKLLEKNTPPIFRSTTDQNPH